MEWLTTRGLAPQDLRAARTTLDQQIIQLHKYRLTHIWSIVLTVTVRVTHTGTEGGYCQGDPYRDWGWSLSGWPILGLRVVTVRVTHTGTEGGHCQGDPYRDWGWSLSGWHILGLKVVTVRVTHTGTEGGHCQGDPYRDWGWSLSRWPIQGLRVVTVRVTLML